MLAGIDASINGSAIAFEDGSYHLHSQTKYLTENITTPDLTAYKTPKSKRAESNLKRFHESTEDLLAIIIGRGVSKVAIEDYAYSATGQVFNIGEFVGLLKHKLFMAGIEIEVFAPTAVKKIFTGKGNASKVKMVDTYFKKYPNSIIEKYIKEKGIESKRYESPVNDLVDARAVLEMIL